jgi:glutathione synthase
MALKVALQMDPIADRSTSTAIRPFASGEEAQARGHELFYYTPDRLAFQSRAG